MRFWAIEKGLSGPAHLRVGFQGGNMTLDSVNERTPGLATA